MEWSPTRAGERGSSGWMCYRATKACPGRKVNKKITFFQYKIQKCSEQMGGWKGRGGGMSHGLLAAGHHGS